MDSMFLANYMCCMDNWRQQQEMQKQMILNANQIMEKSYVRPNPYFTLPQQDYSDYIPQAVQRKDCGEAIYFSEIPKENKKFSKEIYDKNGNMEAKIVMKEKNNHVFIISCQADEKKMKNNLDIVLDMVLSLLDNIHTDTPYVVAEVKSGAELYSKVLKICGFKQLINKEYNYPVFILK